MKENKLGCFGSLLNTFGLLPRGDYDTNEIIPYALRDDFLSKAEFSFYRVISNVLKSEYLICPKVSLRDIFFVTDTMGENKIIYINKINRKHIDFLICNNNTMEPIMGIELDDASHNKPSRKERDIFVDKLFNAAGIPLLRFKAKYTYIPSEIAKKIESEFNHFSKDKSAKSTSSNDESERTICPKCGAEMKLKTAKSGKFKGQQFYGCNNFPKCREIINL